MAAPKVKFKRSSVANKRPSLSDLELGELALNTYDGKLFTRQDTGGVGIATTVTLVNPWDENFGGDSISYDGDVSASNINLDGIVVGVATISNTISIADKIVHTGDTNTAIRFPAADTITAETAGSERFRITSDGKFGFGTGANIDERGHIETASGNCRLKLQTGDTSVAGFVLQTSAKRFDVQAQNDFFQIYDNTAATERLRIDSSGRLLVGTTSSSGDHILEVNSGTDNEGIKVVSTDAGSYIRFADNSTTAQIRLGAVGDDFKIDVNASERLRITSDGKFGFGTNNPQGTVHISSGTSGDATLILEADTDNSNDADNPYIVFRQDGGINASAIGHGVDSGVDGNGLTIANSISSGFISFATGTTNGYTNATERLRISSNGNVGINSTSPSERLDVGGTTKTEQLNVTGVSTFANTISIAETIEHTGDTNTSISFPSNDYIRLTTAGSSRLNATPNGYILLGTNNEPSGGDAHSRNARLLVQGRIGNNADSGRLNLQRGSSASNGSSIGSLTFTDNSNNAYARIETLADGIPGTNDYPGRIVFSTTPDGQSTPTEKFRISANGTASFAGDVSIADKIIHTGDTDTGIRFPAADTLTLITNANERLRIDSNGDVGVGIADPQERLHVARIVMITGNTPQIRLNANDSDANDDDRTMLGQATGNGNFVSTAVDNDTILRGTATGSLIFGIGTVERLRVHSTGNIGINKTNPAEKLDVGGIIKTQDLIVTGSLSKGSGSFKIDHPLVGMSTTHNLVHSFIEGPQADLIYRGKVDLVNGSATVNIDTAGRMTEGTFVALCTNVQCFTTNETDWTAIKGSVSGNTLTVLAQDNSCTATVSWMVVGERKDQHMIDTNWTDDNGRVITEPPKTD